MVLTLVPMALSVDKDLYIIHIETSRKGGTAQTVQCPLLCIIKTHLSVNKSVEFCKRY